MAVNASEAEPSFSIIDPGMTIKAMRDSGYKSTTQALAELIDNSIESQATAIEVFGVSRRNDRTGRFTLDELAVLDNGEGMDGDTLRGSLRYGHGTRRERRGIGRFGHGLPNSPMSQARRVDVWSWQSGVTNAFHTRLSLDEVEGGAREIPEPARRTIPSIYLDASRNVFGDSGTLVVWRDLDRVEWKQASTTFKHTEILIGRIYRRFLVRQSERPHSGDPGGAEIGPRRTITLIPIREDGAGTEVQEADLVEVRPNDPLYLMTGTSRPEDFGPDPMFTELEGSPFSVPVRYRDKEYEVRVRASYIERNARRQGTWRKPRVVWPIALPPRRHRRAPLRRPGFRAVAAPNVHTGSTRSHRADTQGLPIVFFLPTWRAPISSRALERTSFKLQLDPCSPPSRSPRPFLKHPKTRRLPVPTRTPVSRRSSEMISPPAIYGSHSSTGWRISSPIGS